MPSPTQLQRRASEAAERSSARLQAAARPRATQRRGQRAARPARQRRAAAAAPAARVQRRRIAAARVQEGREREARAAQGRAENQRAVGAAEAEGVRQRDPDRHLARRVRHVVEVALRVGVAQVDGRRRDLVAQRERGEHRLDRRRPRRAGARSSTWSSSPPPWPRARRAARFTATGLGDVAERRGGAVRVDVVDRRRRRGRRP